MTGPIRILPQPLLPTAAKPITGRKKESGGFAEVLDRQLESKAVGFSRHARERMDGRGIHLNETDLARLDGAVDRVAAKGGCEALVLLDDKALIVSVKNRQVVTVLDSTQLKENVFTQIDSAIIA
jgi:flagellar operon protein